MISKMTILCSVIAVGLTLFLSCQPLTDKNVDQRRLAEVTEEDSDDVEFLESPRNNKRKGREILRSNTRETPQNRPQLVARRTENLEFDFPESTEYGDAVYYSDRLSGNVTANGENYNPEALTAAHPSLPFGTVCRVTNLFNGKSVLVRINDRFPVDGRIVIDLSRAAARELEALQAGRVEVKVEADTPSQVVEPAREYSLWADDDRESDNIQFGKAAYYSDALEGRTTASGEPYNRNRLTAAHPSLPFGTICRVTNLFNGQTVEVRINDRCAGRNGRIIDLSYRAANQLDAIVAGVVDVKVEVLGNDEF